MARFRINPNGIVFGQGAPVDVNALLASSLGMSNDFAGKRRPPQCGWQASTHQTRDKCC
jgi:hypothetical protein